MLQEIWLDGEQLRFEREVHCKDTKVKYVPAPKGEQMGKLSITGVTPEGTKLEYKGEVRTIYVCNIQDAQDELKKHFVKAEHQFKTAIEKERNERTVATKLAKSAV